MQKILVVEDNSSAAKNIQKLILDINPNYEVVTFSEAGAAYNYACKEAVSLFILDIQLSDYKGTSLAKQLRALPAYEYTPILFETALAGEELTAYRDVNCYGFLIKPYGEQEFREVFEKAIGLSHRLSNVNRTVRVEQKQFIFEYELQSIVYVESFGKKIAIHTDSPKFGAKQDSISGYSLSRMLELLDNSDFVQCHKSYIVNRKYIEQINKVDRQITLRGFDEKIPIGIKYQSALLG